MKGFFILVFTISSFLSYSQEVILKGIIKEKDDPLQPIPFASVELFDGSRKPRRINSNENGYFIINGKMGILLK